MSPKQVVDRLVLSYGKGIHPLLQFRGELGDVLFEGFVEILQQLFGGRLRLGLLLLPAVVRNQLVDHLVAILEALSDAGLVADLLQRERIGFDTSDRDHGFGLLEE